MRPLPLAHRIMLIINILLLLGLVGSYSATMVDPRDFWPLAFFGLSYPFLLLGNIFFVLYWILFKRKLFLVSLIVILIGYKQISSFFQINFSDGPMSQETEKVQFMTFNVRLFGLYEWGTNKQTRDRIFDLLKNEQADVMCFQEFFHSRKKGYFETKDSMVQFLVAKNHHEAYTHHVKDQHHFGIATFSKYPIVNKGEIEFPNEQNNLCIYSDLRIGSDTIRVYNAHLASIRTRGDDLSTLEGGRSIFRKLKRAFQHRGEQVELILDHMNESPHPIVLCGDFNDTPVSYAYSRFSEELQDSFVNSGNGLGRTYIGDFPSFRIDHIFHSSSLHSYQHETLPVELSDHRPVQCMIEVTE